jgi:hypothetical protein
MTNPASAAFIVTTPQISRAATARALPTLLIDASFRGLSKRSAAGPPPTATIGNTGPDKAPRISPTLLNSFKIESIWGVNRGLWLIKPKKSAGAYRLV